MEELFFLQPEIVSTLMRGFCVSVKLIIPSATFGFIIGVVVGALRVYGDSSIKAIANGYVLIFRGFPLVVQLFIWYFGLPYIGIYLSPFVAAVMGFSLCSGAYHSEYVRGAFLSVKTGQMMAAKALGFSKIKMVLFVTLPQAFRKALPGCGNEIIYLIKYSSLAYMITCIELTGQGKIIASDTFRYTETFMVIGAIYLVLTSVAAWLLHRLECRLQLPGFEQYG
ncbi:MAG: amino acid ABC transporter permease [Thermodesulfobacteriota bacterium]|nr:amino acid ABC transporter permease [Thermodesulfobacteriota bacterium]